MAVPVVDFLREMNGGFGCIHFFDVAGASAGSACVFPRVAAAAARQFFPRTERPLVLFLRRHRRLANPVHCLVGEPVEGGHG